MKMLTVQIIFVLFLFHAELSAWNIPGHMLSGAMAYQILQRENSDQLHVDFPFKLEDEPASIEAVQPPQENILTA